jgi:dipeptidyl aminopeptidase/acylaminoacyl peptidase
MNLTMDATKQEANTRIATAASKRAFAARYAHGVQTLPTRTNEGRPGHGAFQLCLWPLVTLCLGICGSALHAAHPFSVTDMLAMQRVSDAQVSPDGRHIVFTLRVTDLEQNKGRTDLWLLSDDRTGLRRLTSHPESDHTACWAPHGKTVFFLSGRSGSSQVWRIPLDGGEAEQVTDLALDVSNLRMSPDGARLAFSLEVFPDANTVDATRKRLEQTRARKATGLIYDRIFVRHWDTWKDGRRSHVFVLPTSGQGEPRDVMGHMDADCPSKPFGGREEFTFSPDSQHIVFTARDAGREEPWSTDFDLYRATVDGSTTPVCLTSDNPAWDCCPAFSPDGKTLAYLAMKRRGYESDRYRIVLQPWLDGPKRVLTEDWDRSPSSCCWSHDGRALYATAANLGQRSLFAISADTGGVDTLILEGAARGPAALGTGVVFTHESLRSPAELETVPRDGQKRRKLTSINSHRIAEVRMGDYQQYSFRGHNEETVYGYVLKPVDFDPLRKYPVAFLIHGGPQGSFGNSFHYRWNPQAYAGAGYAVVMVDFHGSVGYGQAFTDSIRGDWGGKPLEDLQKGLAAALERYAWMDGERVGALGASFGGFMINWIAGQWPDRFRCLVNHDGNLDERAAYFNTEELWFPEWDHVGTPWENPEGYEKHNPVMHVQNWKTPMLVIHGALDYRVVDTQGLATFNALQRRGIPSKLLYFPDENHWVLKPHNSMLWHETVIAWLDKWLKNAGTHQSR